MKAGTCKVGDRVKTTVNFAAYPEVKLGTECEIVEIVAQHPGAQDDEIAVHPLTWPGVLCFPCRASDVELLDSGTFAELIVRAVNSLGKS